MMPFELFSCLFSSIFISGENRFSTDCVGGANNSCFQIFPPCLYCVVHNHIVLSYIHCKIIKVTVVLQIDLFRWATCAPANSSHCLMKVWFGMMLARLFHTLGIFLCVNFIFMYRSIVCHICATLQFSGVGEFIG